MKSSGRQIVYRWRRRSILLCNSGGRSIGLVVGAAVILVNGNLTVGSGPPWSVSSRSSGAFGVREVEARKEHVS